jgi:hypothetical protein
MTVERLRGVRSRSGGVSEQILAHIGGLHRQVAIARPRQLVTADQTQCADHNFGRRLHVLEAGILEEIRLEQHTQYRTHVEFRIPEYTHQGIDRLLVARRFDRPGRHLRLVGDEEVVQVTADKFTASRLLHYDVDDVFAVEATRMTQEFFRPVVVILRAILEFPREPALGRARDLGLEGPAGKRPRALANILFGIVAGAEAEQFEQFAAPILVDRRAVVLLVVEPENHRRISGNIQQQVAIIPQPALAEQIDLLQKLVVIVDLGIARRENMVPEQRHLLLSGRLVFTR